MILDGNGNGMMILPIVSNGMMWHDDTFRDNPYHNTAILGGMWGARMDTGMRNTLDQSFRQLINSVRRKNLFKPSNCDNNGRFTQTAQSKQWHKGLDQTMLANWVWPKVAES